MATLWRQYVDGPDSAQIDNDCSLDVDNSLLVPDRNRATALIASSDNEHDRSVFSIITPGYLPAGAHGVWRSRIELIGLPLGGNSTILEFINGAVSPLAVVDIFIGTDNQVNWFNNGGTLTAIDRNDASGFFLADSTVYWIQVEWLGAGAGAGYKKLWINANPTLVGGANVPNINVTGLTGTPSACVLAEARGCIDHLDAGTGYTCIIDRGQLTDGTAPVDETIPVNLVAPSITGTPSVGSVVIGDPGSFSGFGDLSYQWQSDNGSGPVDIDGATTTAFTPTDDLIADTLIFVVTSTNLFGATPASSAPSDPVTSGVPGEPAVLAEQPLATGTPQVGLTLGSSSGQWTSDLPITAYLYQWLASPEPLIDTGFAGAPYLLGQLIEGGSTNTGGNAIFVQGPYIVPHDGPLVAAYAVFGGGGVVAHTRVCAYIGDDSTVTDVIDASTTIVVTSPAEAIAAHRFDFDGGAMLHAGDKIYIGFYNDAGITIPKTTGGPGHDFFHVLNSAIDPFDPTGLPPSPFPIDGDDTGIEYPVYLVDGAFAEEPGETLASHLVSQTELGLTLMCQVVALNAAGASDPAYTNVLGPITLATYPVNIVAPYIADQPIVGVPLFVDPGEYFPNPTSVDFQWQTSRTGGIDTHGDLVDDFSDISGSLDSNGYTPTVRGMYLRVAIIAHGSGGESPLYYSNVVGPVLDAIAPAESGGGPLPWLEFCGTEIGNAARTLSYLRAGLANTMQGHWELGDGDVCGVLSRLNGGTCLVPEVFTSPALDPAPWYDPRDRGSESFLGLVMLDIQGYDSMLSRAIVNKISGLGGGFFGQQNRIPRLWKFRGVLVSSGGAGAEYGLRWLTHALQAACDPCETCELKVRLFCPPDDCSDDEAGERHSYDVALVDGPHEVEPWGPNRVASTTDTLAGCRDWVTVEFVIAAANPFLYQRPVTHLEIDISQQAVCTNICDFLFGSAGDSHCAIVEPPLRGTLGSIYTLSSLEGMGGLLIETYEVCPSLVSQPLDPVLQIELSGIPANSTVIVDSAKHTITVETLDPVTGETTLSDGQHLVVLAEGKALQWAEIAHCDDYHCFCIRAATPCTQGVVHVVLETQVREG